LISQSIAKRYANGLFAVGERDGKYREYLEELDGLLKLLPELMSLQSLLKVC